ncbi:uncharacterized protein LALA0_S06e06502g [Lachancea lanzarotensis]|uniref:LALA0S06e06502g1_1 n=1 Tax=Lachancea lanzarotensis TaxID=1245769 RepID=A0A0C7N8M8_9SACH|nr:uncharacterized protein LALA0_S06e06502g [Lachancea lanzarotensis]CEP62904.1 LALA0S06e06502g1_1 [Lachancea lanzarotensis]
MNFFTNITKYILMMTCMPLAKAIVTVGVSSDADTMIQVRNLANCLDRAGILCSLGLSADGTITVRPLSGNITLEPTGVTSVQRCLANVTGIQVEVYSHRSAQEIMDDDWALFDELYLVNGNSNHAAETTYVSNDTITNLEPRNLVVSNCRA